MALCKTWPFEPGEILRSSHLRARPPRHHPWAGDILGPWWRGSSCNGAEPTPRRGERGAGVPSGGDFRVSPRQLCACKDEKLLINFCVFICAVMGLILINGTLLL